MKKLKLLLLLTALGLSLAACGKKDKEPEPEPVDEGSAIVIEDEKEEPEVEEVVEEEAAATEEPDVAPDGMYASELTGEWIDESLKDQRPVAVMIDDEKTALPHFGVSQVDVLYEMVNSTQNEGVTRFMALVKDWGKIKQLGSIRSTRPTNLQIFPEWGAVLCHDGGPFWNDNFYKNVFVERFSGTFSRVDNGKAREFTEYVLSGDLDKNFKSTGYSTTYTEYYQGGSHFDFASRNNPNTLEQYSNSVACTKINLPFNHNKPWLEYDEAEGVYKYFQYGSAESDAGNGNEQVKFKNLFLMNAELKQLDDHGYMQYIVNDIHNRDAWFITNGRAVPCTWSKQTDLDFTTFTDADGNMIKANVGKSYIALIRNEEWGNIAIQ